jgi:hypothetical protein
VAVAPPVVEMPPAADVPPLAEAPPFAVAPPEAIDPPTADAPPESGDPPVEAGLPPLPPAGAWAVLEHAIRPRTVENASREKERVVVMIGLS